MSLLRSVPAKVKRYSVLCVNHFVIIIPVGFKVFSVLPHILTYINHVSMCINRFYHAIAAYVIL